MFPCGIGTVYMWQNQFCRCWILKESRKHLCFPLIPSEFPEVLEKVWNILLIWLKSQRIGCFAWYLCYVFTLYICENTFSREVPRNEIAEANLTNYGSGGMGLKSGVWSRCLHWALCEKLTNKACAFYECVPLQMSSFSEDFHFPFLWHASIS